MTPRTVTLSLLVTLATLAAAPASAALISYEPHDLGATEAGLWQFDFTLSDYTLAVNEGVQIFFPYGEYQDLALVSSASGWDALVIQPDQIFDLAEPGLLDALQTADTAGAPAVFSVQAHWNGTGTPAPQSYELYDASYAVIDSGQTVCVPEPATFALLAGGLLVTGLRRVRTA